MPSRFIGRRALPTLLLLALLLRAPTLASAAPLDAAAATARVLDLTNGERQKAGLPPLTLNPQLTQAAQRYSQVLASDACFAHTCGPMPDMVQRALQAGYGNWTTVGENIAAGYPSPESVVSGWMDSPDHRANILSPEYRELGVGLTTGGKFGAYWAQEFGTRRGDSGPAFQPLAAPDPEPVDGAEDG
ncbi:MAG TPA: CAP domain-containing protein [Chloroflexota bacterium]|nr:CAP domain-containing protein [Chloroflexota bacterium]